MDVGTVLTVWYFVIFHGCWNWPDSVVFWTSMKNNKIPQSGQFQNPIEKQQNTTLSGQFQHPWKTTKYHTVRTFLTVWYFVVFHRCWNWPDSVVFCCFSIGTVLTVWYFVVFHGCWNWPDSVVFSKYHTVRTVPIEKQENITLSGQFQHLWKTTKYHTVRTVLIEK
jgi:hypothetical protein